MKPQKNLFLFLFALFIGAIAHAQTFMGKVVNEKNEPVENVYVYNKTANVHTHTELNGTFKLENCKVGDSVDVAILGYKKLEIVLTANQLNKKQTLVLESKSFVLDELVISNKVNPIQTFVKMDLQLNPVTSSQEILRKVPGLFIGQHAGGGKAEQIFLRGFDVDHGTDLALSVDGIPVNMVSHAHGQGYSDLHFIIPETIDKINFGKGPYYANKGDFNTAGYVDFETKLSIDKNKISVGLGDFNYFRTLGMFNLLEKKANESAYLAVEYLEFDGPFESPQNFNRINFFTKYNTFLKSGDRITLTASHFTSRWDASGQIPERAIKNGHISRFGAIDDTEGGNTARTNLNLQLNHTLNNDDILKTNAFYTHYNFKLYSDFTFFLNDPVNGDQIRQAESRDIFGMNSQIIKKRTLGDADATFTIGTGFRADLIKNDELSHTVNRKQTLANIQLGDVNQTNFYVFFNSEFEMGNFKISPAVRLDYLKFMYNDHLQPTYQTLSDSKVIVNPKLNFTYSPNNNLQWFLKTGIGFHSNDTRVVVKQNGKKILPRAYGADFGTIWKPTPKIVLNTTLWYLFLEEEFVYVGDAGIVEPSGKTKRYGLDFSLRYQLAKWLYFDTDATVTKARSVDDPAGQNYIPLAPRLTVTGGLSLKDFHRFSGGIKFRHMGNRPANEDNSIVAEGYFVTDANINYTLQNLTFGLAIQNLFNVDWKETQFATESRLQSEPSPVEEIHFTPGTPFAAKFKISYTF